MIKTTLSLLLALAVSGSLFTACGEHPAEYEGWTLVWHDEFSKDGTPDPESWIFEKGFVRNHELQ